MKVAFYKGTMAGWRGMMSRLVRFGERGRYSHCEIVFSDGLSASASWRDGGVRLKKIKFNPDHWDFINLGDDWPSEAIVRDWFVREQGRRYDIRGSFGVAFRPLSSNSECWFCSEAVAAALGMHEPWRFGPNALAALLKE